MCPSNIFVMNPTGTERTIELLRLAPRSSSLEGLTVGLLDVGRWETFAVVLQHYGVVLKERYGVVQVVYVNTEKQAMESGLSREQAVPQMASQCDAVILGLGRGSSTSGLVLNAIEFEKLGVPAVAFITDWFQSMADTVSKGSCLPDVKVVAVPHPFDGLPEAEAIEIADKVLDKAIAAITNRRASEES